MSPDDEMPVDDLISAAMMQRAVGNPNASVPTKAVPVSAGRVLKSKKRKPPNLVQQAYRDKMGKK